MRKYSPDLILLSHRLQLGKGMPYATTYLLGGAETYIDVHMANHQTAPDHRARALSRGVVTAWSGWRRTTGSAFRPLWTTGRTI